MPDIKGNFTIFMYEWKFYISKSYFFIKSYNKYYIKVCWCVPFLNIPFFVTGALYYGVSFCHILVSYGAMKVLLRDIIVWSLRGEALDCCSLFIWYWWKSWALPYSQDSVQAEIRTRNLPYIVITYFFRYSKPSLIRINWGGEVIRIKR
jgi:uncharacterized membrane-anchored protein YitT (DUF2179 family)